MKLFVSIVIPLIFFNNLSLSTPQLLPAPVVDEKPLLVVIIMVKNEKPVMEATLKPFFDAGVQHYVVLDTGSTDGTVKFTRALFKKNNIQHGYVIEQPFVNFSASRNYALKGAEHIFPGAAFFFVIDAEWYVHNIKGLLDFCQKYKSFGYVTFSIKRKLQQFRELDYINWLFRPRCGVKFVGVVHECVNHGAGMKAPEDIYIYYNPSGDGKRKSKDRWYRDCNLLTKEHEKHPNDLRTIFYLAQTYACLDDKKQALAWYKKRCTNVRDNDEENHLAHYRIGMIYESWGMWPEALLYYCLAHDIRPSRVEPIVRMAKYYFDKQEYVLAFLLANYAANIPLPFQEMLMMNMYAYHVARYDILALASWHLGEYEVGFQATMKALHTEPSNEIFLDKAFLFDLALQHCKCNKLDRSVWCDWCNGNFWLSRSPWLDACCFSYPRMRSNRCNSFQGFVWRNWF